MHNANINETQEGTENTSDMSVWKVGSRWSYDGNADSSILEIFRRHSIVFVGKDQHLFEQIKVGDLIAIGDGVTVVALGRVNVAPKPLPEFRIPFSRSEEETIEPRDEILTCRVEFIDLKPADHFYGGRRTIHRLNQKRETALLLYKNYHESFSKKQEFEIQARSCTLAANSANPEDVLWRSATCYRIPIFQRPYSWGEAEVRRLVNDLLTAYFGRNGRVEQEPMFIGTMQLMVAESVDLDGFNKRHDIIDGQQRITTLILILRALESLSPTAVIWQTLDYRRRLATTVSGDIQQTYLQRALNEIVPSELEEKEDDDVELNAYRRNLRMISTLLNEDERLGDNPGDAPGFAEYLSSRVYFVIIETRAQLSKMLQIFDAINTSGMDLNGGDIFKIRYYEFLRERKGAPEAIFKEVCALYERIDQGNKDRKREAVNMEDVLSLAQQILITDHGLSVETRNLAGTTFFERLFDVILGIQAWENFQKDKCEQVELPLTFIGDLIDVSFRWEDTLPTLSPEAQAMTRFIWWSRYGRYHYLVPYFLLRFQPGTVGAVASQPELEEFIIELSKLTLIYSICFQKITNDGRHKMRRLMAILSRGNTATTPREVIDHLVLERAAQVQATLHALLHDHFAHIPKAKNLVCRLDAMLEELGAGTGSRGLSDLLFNQRIDIEHIESFNHQDLNERNRIQTEWGTELHQLGNLIILEYNLNRSVGNGDYAATKRERYEAESSFGVVRDFARSYPAWNRGLAIERRKTLAEKLAAYLCGPLKQSPDSLTESTRETTYTPAELS